MALFEPLLQITLVLRSSIFKSWNSPQMLSGTRENYRSINHLSIIQTPIQCPISPIQCNMLELLQLESESLNLDLEYINMST